MSKAMRTVLLTGLVLLVSGAVAFEIAEKAFWIRYTRQIPITAGPEAMVGRQVTGASACRPAGRVLLGHESWNARCAEGAGIGESLVIDSVENTTLVVSRPSVEETLAYRRQHRNANPHLGCS